MSNESIMKGILAYSQREVKRDPEHSHKKVDDLIPYLRHAQWVTGKE